MYNPVNVLLNDSTPAKLPLAGVTLAVLNADGTQLLTQEQSGVDGVVPLFLATGQYQLRLFRPQTLFRNPRYIEVADGVDNTFEIGGVPFTGPISLDQRFCLATGFFVRGCGAPAGGLTMHFVPQYQTAILDGRGVLGERVTLQLDRSGYGEVSLVRCAKYDVMVVGMDDRMLPIVVPDAPSVNLPDLLFPVVQAAVFDPPAPFSVSVGATLDVVPAVSASDGQQLVGTATEDVQWSTSDPSIVTVSVTATKLTLLGRSPGTAELLVSRRNVSVPKIPAVAILGNGASITVT